MNKWRYLGLLEYSVVLRYLVLLLQPQFLLLLLQDVVHQHPLVLEPVTLDHHVQLVVLVLVDLQHILHSLALIISRKISSNTRGAEINDGRQLSRNSMLPIDDKVQVHQIKYPWGYGATLVGPGSVVTLFSRKKDFQSVYRVNK